MRNWMLWIALMWAVAGFAAKAQAEEFPSFQVNDAVGWVETNNTPTRRIKVLPILSGPGGVYWSTSTDPWGFSPFNPGSQPEGIDFASDGRLRFGFRIISQTRFLPPNFRDVVANQIGVMPASLASHGILFVKPRSVTVKLEVSGKLVDSRTYQAALIPDEFTDYFYLDLGNEALSSAIMRGDYRLSMDYRASYASYGLVEISLTQKILTTAWTETFRELIKRRRSSTTSFLFFKFRDEVQRVIARENFQGGASTNIQQNLAITRVDADASQVELIDKAIGIMESNRSEIVALHTAALAAARTAGDPQLAAAHKAYLDNLSTETGANTNWLDALQALSDDKVLKFLGAGFQSSEGTSYSYYRYNGSSRITVDTTASTQYSDYLIRNSEVSLQRLAAGNSSSINAAFGHLRAKYFGNFGPASPADWAKGVRGIILANDIGGLKFAFSDAFTPDMPGGSLMPLIDVDATLDANGNRALHLAVDRQNRAMVDFLLSRAANPGLKNRFQETSIDRAVDLGSQTLAAALRTAQRPDGLIRIRIATPVGQMTGSQTLLPTSKISKVTQISSTETVIEVSGFPGLIHGQWMISYRAMVPAASVPSLGFPVTIIGYNGGNAIIEYSIMVLNQYKIFSGQTREYDEKSGIKNGILMNVSSA